MGAVTDRHCPVLARCDGIVIPAASAGLRCQARDVKKWGGVRATTGIIAGKAYFEATVQDEGLCRIGWSSKSAVLDVGTSAGSFGYGGTGKKSNQQKFEDYGEPFGQVCVHFIHLMWPPAF